MRCGIVEDEDAGVGAREAHARRSRSTCPTRRSGAGSSRASPICSGSRTGIRGDRGEPVLGLADPLRAARRAVPDGPGLRGHAVGRRRRCSTSSSTCWTGRAASRSSCSRSPVPSSPRSARPGAPASAASRPLYLEPLPPQAMDELLTGLVPGLPDELRERILERAEGVPLYAVETVRMLLDRGLLVRGGRRLPADRPDRARSRCPRRCTRSIAARLDGLTPEERRLVQDGAVLGKTFTKQGLTALTGLSDAASWSRSSPRSSARRCSRSRPIRARPSAASTPSSRTSSSASPTRRSRSEDRKAKHLAAAEFLLALPGGDEDEIVEVVAAHYIDASRRRPTQPDAAEIRDRPARCSSGRASGPRRSRRRRGAACIRAGGRPERRPARQAGAATSAPAPWRDRGARGEEARACFERAIELFEGSGATHAAARVAARLAEVMWDLGRLEDGLERMNASFELLSQEEPGRGPRLARGAARPVPVLRRPDASSARQRIEAALDNGRGPPVAGGARPGLTTKGDPPGRPRATRRRRSPSCGSRSRRRSSTTSPRRLCARPTTSPTARSSSTATRRRSTSSATASPRAAASATATGSSPSSARVYPFFAVGDWDEALAMFGGAPDRRVGAVTAGFFRQALRPCDDRRHRGTLDDARRILDRFQRWERRQTSRSSRPTTVR